MRGPFTVVSMSPSFTILIYVVLLLTAAHDVVLEQFSNTCVTTVTTSATFTNTTFNDTECLCKCDTVEEAVSSIPSTQEEAAKAAAELVVQLSVDRSNLSSTTRKKTSAPDYRPSAQGLGAVGVIVIVAVIASIVALDLTTLIRDVKATARRLLGYETAGERGPGRRGGGGGDGGGGGRGRRGGDGGGGGGGGERPQLNGPGAGASHIYPQFPGNPAQPSADANEGNGEGAAARCDVRAASDAVPEPLTGIPSGVNDIRSRREQLLLHGAPH